MGNVMRTIKLFTIVLLFVLFLSGRASALKIVAYNMQGCVGTSRGYWEYGLDFWRYLLPHSSEALHGIADFIKAERIDIAAFSEIEGASFRGGGIDQPEVLSRMTELKSHVFYPTHRLLGLGNQGNAIHSRGAILSWKNIRLPGGGEARYLGVALMQMHEARTTVMVTHLSLSRSKRMLQIERIARAVMETKGPCLLAGDFNTRDESELLPIIKNGMRLVETGESFPSWRPSRRPDRIFVSREFRVIRGYASANVRYSDHLPVVAEVDLD